mmetsp:Transcript_24547/g.79268  ORF Transcript_24547/g.79268 Transcript_24547/m.79268 type:complete len:253 (+) Transcript_24547:660-1418(+)
MCCDAARGATHSRAYARVRAISSSTTFSHFFIKGDSKKPLNGILTSANEEAVLSATARDGSKGVYTDGGDAEGVDAGAGGGGEGGGGAGGGGAGRGGGGAEGGASGGCATTGVGATLDAVGGGGGGGGAGKGAGNGGVARGGGTDGLTVLTLLRSRTRPSACLVQGLSSTCADSLVKGTGTGSASGAGFVVVVEAPSLPWSRKTKAASTRRATKTPVTTPRGREARKASPVLDALPTWGRFIRITAHRDAGS